MKFNHSRPVKIVSYGKNKELILDEDSLKNILFQPKALGKKVCLDDKSHLYHIKSILYLININKGLYHLYHWIKS